MPTEYDPYSDLEVPQERLGTDLGSEGVQYDPFQDLSQEGFSIKAYQEELQKVTTAASPPGFDSPWEERLWKSPGGTVWLPLVKTGLDLIPYTKYMVPGRTQEEFIRLPQQLQTRALLLELLGTELMLGGPPIAVGGLKTLGGLTRKLVKKTPKILPVEDAVTGIAAKGRVYEWEAFSYDTKLTKAFRNAGLKADEVDVTGRMAAAAGFDDPGEAETEVEAKPEITQDAVDPVKPKVRKGKAKQVKAKAKSKGKKAEPKFTA